MGLNGGNGRGCLNNEAKLLRFLDIGVIIVCCCCDVCITYENSVLHDNYVVIQMNNVYHSLIKLYLKLFLYYKIFTA